MKKISILGFCACLFCACSFSHDTNISMFQAAEEGNFNAVKYHVEQGENINQENEKRYSPLMLASEYGRVGIVKFLITNGANVNAKSFKDGKTALILASENSHIEIIGLLIKAGADVNAQDDLGQTALMHSSRLGDVSVNMLIKAGADVNIKDRNFKTALMFAEENEYPEIVKILKQAGAKE